MIVLAGSNFHHNFTFLFHSLHSIYLMQIAAQSWNVCEPDIVEAASVDDVTIRKIA